MIVTLNGDKCMGCGVCAEIAPDVFSLDIEKGIAEVVRSEGNDKVVLASESCPVSCIEIQK